MATGLLGFLDWTSEERAREERAFEERRKHEERESAKAAEVAAYEADVQDVYDKLEAMFTPHLHEEAAAVNTATRIKPSDRKVFEQFKQYCATAWDPPLPPLPAHPAAVCAFLVKGLSQGTTHFTKRLNAISRIHSAVNMPDPTRDVLCQALVRKIKPTRKTGE
jgi:hypothetical protein